MAEARQSRYVKRNAAQGKCTLCGRLAEPIRAKDGNEIIGRRRKCTKHLKAEREAKKKRAEEKMLASKNGAC